MLLLGLFVCLFVFHYASFHSHSHVAILLSYIDGVNLVLGPEVDTAGMHKTWLCLQRLPVQLGEYSWFPQDPQSKWSHLIWAEQTVLSGESNVFPVLTIPLYVGALIKKRWVVSGSEWQERHPGGENIAVLSLKVTFWWERWVPGKWHGRGRDLEWGWVTD